jgi:hypothetical protein
VQYAEYAHECGDDNETADDEQHKCTGGR